MTVFDTLFTGIAEPVLKENFGESAVHEAPDGTQTTLTAVFGAERTREIDAREGRVRQRELVVSVFKSELEGVVIKHGRLTRNGEVWTIDEVDHETGTLLGLLLSRNEPVEIARPGFRNPQQ